MPSLYVFDHIYLTQIFFYLKLAPGGQSHVPLADQQEDSDEPDVSLITGALRSHNLLISEPAESTYSSSVVLRNQEMTVATTNSAGVLHFMLFAFNYLAHIDCYTLCM